MFAWLKERKTRHGQADKLYGSIVAQARQPAFYSHLGVPDSLEGRYEMIVLHLFLAMERLQAEGHSAHNLSRCLVERFVTDMDDCMRELGVGDLSVPKKVKRAAAGFFERAGTYRAALETGQTALARAVRAYLSETEDIEPSQNDQSLAAYVVASAKALADQQLETIVSKGPRFADLAGFSTGERK